MASLSECYVSSDISKAFLECFVSSRSSRSFLSRSPMPSFQQTRFSRSSMLSFPQTCSPITALVPVCFPQIKQTRSKFEIKSHMGDLSEGMEDSVELEEKIWKVRNLMLAHEDVWHMIKVLAEVRFSFDGTILSNNDIGFGGNVLFKNELNQDIPLEQKIEDLYADELGDFYADDIPLLPNMRTLSPDAKVKLKLYQVGELIYFYQKTFEHEKGRYGCLVVPNSVNPFRPTLLVGGKNILGVPHRPLIGVLEWHVIREGEKNELHPYLHGVVNYIYISQIAVLINFRRQKVATSLMISCEELTKKEGYKFIVLQVLKGNWPARSLFIKMGYYPVRGKEETILMKEISLL